MKIKKVLISFAFIFTSQVYANLPVIDATNLMTAIDNLYNGYEKLLVAYNSMKTQAEQYQKQIESMKTMSEKIKDIGESWSNAGEAFKDLNSFQNLTNLQKVEASRRKLKSAVKTTNSIVKDKEDALLKGLNVGFRTADGRQYSYASLLGIPGVSGGTLSDLKLNARKGIDGFSQSMKEAFDGHLSMKERRKLQGEWGVPAFYLIMKQDAEEKKLESLITNQPTDNIEAEATALQNSLSTAVDEAGNSQIAQQEAGTQVNLAILESQQKNLVAELRWQEYCKNKDRVAELKEQIVEKEIQIQKAKAKREAAAEYRRNSKTRMW